MGKKDWSPKARIFISLVGGRDPYPLVYSGYGTRMQFGKDWDKAVARASQMSPEWNYDDVNVEMEALGYKPLDREWIIGEE